MRNMSNVVELYIVGESKCTVCLLRRATAPMTHRGLAEVGHGSTNSARHRTHCLGRDVSIPDQMLRFNRRHFANRGVCRQGSCGQQVW